VIAMSHPGSGSFGSALVDLPPFSLQENVSTRLGVVSSKTPQIIRKIDLALNSTYVAPILRSESGTTKGFAASWWINGREIRFPMHVTLEPADGEILAQNPDTGIFGVAGTPAEALEDLRVALVDHYRILVNAGDAIFDDLRAQREFLTSHLAV